MDTTIPYPARLARYQFVEALVRVADAKFKQDISAGQSSFELSSCGGDAPRRHGYFGSAIHFSLGKSSSKLHFSKLTKFC